MTVERTSPVGRVAAEYPVAAKVFFRHHIDYCCGGNKALSAACAESGADVEVVIAEIDEELRDNTSPPRRWDEAPLDELVDHTLIHYHRPLNDELPRLRALADKVNRKHGSKDPERFAEIVAVLDELSVDLMKHMASEEKVLFPAVRLGKGAMAAGAMELMEDEHEFAGVALKRLRELTWDYEVPEDACETWRALWLGIAALEEQMYQHIHLENNILFPRALES